MDKMATEPVTVVAVNPFSYVQMFLSVGMLVEAARAYRYKIYDLNHDLVSYPVREYVSGANTNRKDIDWVKTTNEYRGWLNCVKSFESVYGTQLALWLINHYFDN